MIVLVLVVSGEEAAAASLAAVPPAAPTAAEPTAAAPAATAAGPSAAPAAAAAELEAFAKSLVCGISHGGGLWELEQVAGIVGKGRCCNVLLLAA